MSRAGGGEAGARDIDLALRTLTLKTSCSHCGAEGAALKRCSRCLHVWYCGGTCQKQAWKGHKKSCEPPVAIDDVRERVGTALDNVDWQEVLKWEGRMEELMEGEPDGYCDWILKVFAEAHKGWHQETGDADHLLAIGSLEVRRVALLGNMERFRDQGEAMCDLGSNLIRADRMEEALVYFQRARKVGEAHGLFAVECTACLGLGRVNPKP